MPKCLPLEGKVHGEAVTDEVPSTRALNDLPPHQSPAATASPQGEAFGVSYLPNTLFSCHFPDRYRPI